MNMAGVGPASRRGLGSVASVASQVSVSCWKEGKKKEKVN